jgi:hypothetical protein
MTAGATFYISGPTLGHVPGAFHTHGKDSCWIVTLVSAQGHLSLVTAPAKSA